MYRAHLPQLDGGLFITDGGLETTLIFHRGVELPVFAAFPLLKDEEGTEQIRAYYEPYARIARERGVGLILESPTWRANPDWAAEIGYSLDELDSLNRKAIELMEEIRDGERVRLADRDQRLHRAAGRRLQPRGDALARRGAALSLDPDRDASRAPPQTWSPHSR